MPAKKEERGAEIDSCSLKISEEKIKILLRIVSYLSYA